MQQIARAEYQPLPIVLILKMALSGAGNERSLCGDPINRTAAIARCG
jgi:hypothetical protein